jgi:hypothetical protein
MLSRLRSFFHVPTTAELEQAYLEGSANRYDLELRQREIDRGVFSRRHMR